MPPERVPVADEIYKKITDAKAEKSGIASQALGSKRAPLQLRESPI